MTPLIGHEGILRELEQLAAGADPPHALMLVGPAGIGRTALALHHARLLNCQAAEGRGAQPPGFAGFEPEPDAVPCGRCRACRLISEKVHPDVVQVGPGDTLCRPRGGESGHERHPTSRDIRICQVRGMIDLVSRYPVEARYRVLIIEPAERLGREAANTLLKTLEEPPGHTVFILVTAAPEAMPETIISRCRRIDVRPVPREVIEAGLVERGIAPDLAARAAAEARGRPVKALAFAAHPDEMAVRERLLERCRKIAGERRLGPRLAYAGDLAERWRRDRESVAAEIDAWETFWEEQLVASAASGGAAVQGSVNALKAVAQARADLLGQVLTRPALELMLLHFPRGTLIEAPESEAPTRS